MPVAPPPVRSRTAPPPGPRSRRTRGLVRFLVGTVVFAGVAAGGAAGVAALLARADAEPRAHRCAAALDGTDWYLEPDQAETAALLAGTALQRGLPARALTIGIATGLQESKLRNIDYGDRDSVGVFQQRPSQGWGTVEQIMDPVYSTGAFYDALVRVDGYQEMAVTEAAQAVQRSGFPDAYAQHEARARAWANAFYGYSPMAVTCTLPSPEGPAELDRFVERAGRDLGIAPVPTEGGVVLDADALVADPAHAERLGWALAHWSVTVAEPLGVVEVHHAGSVWRRDDGQWRPDEGEDAAAPMPGGLVRVVLAD